MSFFNKRERNLAYVPNNELTDSDGGTVPVRAAPDGVEPNLVTSLLDDGTHLPCLDIDFAARLVPSSTEGHYHLYLDGMNPLPWERYEALLKALADAGIVSRGYANHSIERKCTCLRRPGVKKGETL